MKIFAVNGSPTMQQGMTHALLEPFFEGAKEAGAEVDYVFLQKQKIGYCLGCYKCWLKHAGECIQKDDMAGLLERLNGCDVFVIGTPLYYDGMTAQTKTFIDRTLPMLDPYFELVNGRVRHVVREGIKPPKIVLASVCGCPEKESFSGLVDHVERLSQNMQAEFIGAVLRPAGSILKKKDQMPEAVGQIKTAAKEAGKQLVEKGAFELAALDAVAKEYFSAEAFIENGNQFWDLCFADG